MSLRKLFLVVSLLLWMVGAADAQTLRVTADRTNLRDKPTTDGAIVGSVVKGDQLTVVERAGPWYRVRAANGTEGYVSSLLVEVVSGAPVPTPSAPAPALPPAAPAVAQPRTPPPAQAPPTAAVTASQATQQPDRSTSIRVMGGLVTGYADAGFVVSGGVGGIRPFSVEALEVVIDGFVGRSGSSFSTVDYSTTVLGGSGSVIYNFDAQGFTPFAGAGITVARSSYSQDFNINLPGYEDTFGFSGTHAGVHLVGGFEKPFSDSRAFRAEIRSGFYGVGSSLLLLAGISF